MLNKTQNTAPQADMCQVTQVEGLIEVSRELI